MSDPTYSNKRPKMEGTATSTGGSSKIFIPESQNFEIIRQQSGFVDHTELIKVFFGSGTEFKPETLFVSGPSHFCKSSNLHMLQTFYGLKRDGNVEESHEQRYMFRTFAGLKIMETADSETLNDHFCAHPVVFVDFKTTAIRSYNDALDFCFRVIKRAFVTQEALLRANLESEAWHLSRCSVWWNAQKWKDVGIHTLHNGLAVLCNILFFACKKRVLVLVDDCGDVIAAALSNTEVLSEVAMTQIYELMRSILADVARGHIHERLQGVLFTGISYVMNLQSRKGKNMLQAGTETYTFLLDKPCINVNSDTRAVVVRSYGLYEPDLDGLLKRLNREGKLTRSVEEETEIIKRRCNGYYSQTGERILSLWSVLHYLDSDSSKDTHAEMGDVVKCYKKAFAGAEVGRLVLKLLARQEIGMVYVKWMELSELVLLRCGAAQCDSRRNTLLSLLMDAGFVTIASSSSDSLNVIVPNEEIRRTFQATFVDSNIQIGMFDESSVKECALIIDSLRRTCLLDDATEYKTHLKSFHENLVKLFKGFSRYAPRHRNELELESLMWYALTYTRRFTVIPEYITKARGDLWLKYDDEEFFIVLKLRVCKEKGQNETSLCALNQIKGKEEHSETDNTIDLAGKNYLLMGLTMDATFAPSICVQSSKSAERIFFSETEQAFQCFGSYYDGCYDLFNNTYV